MKRSAIVMAALMMLVGGEGFSATLKCEITKKSICSKGACTNAEVGREFMIVNTDNETYSLCTHGKSKCQVIKLVDTSYSGVFVFFSFGGNSYLKMSTVDVEIPVMRKGEFMEVRDFHLGVFNSYGQCQPLR